MRNEIKEILDVHNEALSERYLGMPIDVGTSVNGAFIISRTECGRRCRAGWSNACLQEARKF